MMTEEKKRGVYTLSAPMIYGFALICASLLFFQLPEIDFVASDFFYLTSGAFLLEGKAWVKYIRKLQYPFYALIVLFGVAGLCGGALFLQRYLRRDLSVKKFSAILLLTLALGPGIFVNLYSKEYWGRPRPHQIIRYGGEAPHVNVWTKADYCVSNCSFVAGESSGAAWFSVFAYLLHKKYRKKALFGFGAFFLLISYFRLGAGGHFLSDIVIGALAVFLINSLIVNTLYKNRKSYEPLDNF